MLIPGEIPGPWPLVTALIRNKQLHDIQNCSLTDLIADSIVLTLADIPTIASPRGIITRLGAVATSPAWRALTAISSSASTLTIYRVTQRTVDTRTSHGAVLAPEALRTRLVTELTKETTAAGTGSCKWIPKLNTQVALSVQSTLS